MRQGGAPSDASAGQAGAGVLITAIAHVVAGTENPQHDGREYSGAALEAELLDRQ